MPQKGALMANFPGTNGDDTLYGTSDPDTIIGMGGNDTLVGFGGADSLDGGDGIDTAFYFDSNVGVGINLQTGQGSLGSAEGDTLTSVENVWGSSYNDSLLGDDGDNQLVGLDGNDVLKGGGGADSLDGGSGDDILKGGGGADHFEGGPGIDTVDYSDSPSSGGTGIYGISVDLYPGDFPGHGVGADAQGDTYSNIENVTGSAYEDYLAGTDDANVLEGQDGDDDLVGNGGNDTLDGGNGADRLTGGLGDDFLRGGPGADELNGGGGPVTLEGSDTADYSDKTEGVTVTLNSSVVVNVLVGGVVEDTMRNIENVIGGTGNDRLTGDNFANQLTGKAGDDFLDGGAGADILNGGNGNDIYVVDNVGDRVKETGAATGTDKVKSSVSFTLGANVENLTLTGTDATSGKGNGLANSIIGNNANNVLRGLDGDDSLSGGAGNDQLYGGLGVDRLIGGSGADRFVFDSALGGTNHDVIKDFSVADDTIVLDRSIFDAFTGNGRLAASAFFTGNQAHDADDRIIYDSVTGNIYYDADGSGAGAQVLFAHVTPGLALTNADFQIVG